MTIANASTIEVVMRIVSWNVNGLRAVWARRDLDWALGEKSDVDVMCLQETKLHDADLSDDMRAPPGFVAYFSFGKRKGYSGTAIYVREQLASSRLAFALSGDPTFNEEGRIVAVDVGGTAIINIYFPNGGSGDDRLAFKHAFNDALFDAVTALAQKMPVVLLGDFNIAHQPIDVALPDKWNRFSGFLEPERAWLTRLLDAGFIDTFRFDQGNVPHKYTFWETRIEARNDNLGWRIDYVLISKSLEEKLESAFISSHVLGSDHCPVGITIDLGASKNDDDWQLADDDNLIDEDDDNVRLR